MTDEEKEAWHYARRYYRYTHVGCPGEGFEDNCARPDECAEMGGCRVLREQAARVTQ